MGWLRNLFGADKVEDAQRLATQQAVAGQTEALNYLKETEKLPMQFRDQALTGLAGFYQVPGQAKPQDQLIQEAMNSPLYAAIMGTKNDALDTVLRNASATGGLRSGNTNEELAKASQQVSERALLESFNQLQARDDYNRNLNLTGLTGLAGLQGNDQAIAALLANRGNTQAQGTVAIGQNQASTMNNIINAAVGGYTAYKYSDIRLKDKIRLVGKKNGLNWYKWAWNKAAEALGLSGESEGVLAHEAYDHNPRAVFFANGFLKVNYDVLEAA